MSEPRPESFWEQVNRLLGRYLSVQTGLPADLLSPEQLAKAWRSLPGIPLPLPADPDARSSPAGTPQPPDSDGTPPEPASAPDAALPADLSDDPKAEKTPGAAGSSAPYIQTKEEEPGNPLPTKTSGQTEDEIYGDSLPKHNAGGGQIEDELFGDTLPGQNAGAGQTEDEIYGDTLPGQNAGNGQIEDELFGDTLPGQNTGAGQIEDEIYGDSLPKGERGRLSPGWGGRRGH